MKIGIDIGGTSVKIGLVDSENQIIATAGVSTGNQQSASSVIEQIAKSVLTLLEEQHLTPEQCDGIGIGVPGLVNRHQGRVVYSNNLCWEDVPLAVEIQKYIPLPVRIANDADCAVLGEAVSGAGKGVDNLVMLTLGTGVGGGIILNGSLFEGSLLGGVELGHTTLKSDGELCTCGRKGCLEAYASATAMRREAKKVYGESREPFDIFNAAQSGDEKAQKIVDAYIQDLGAGIVNLVNIFRPEKFLLGGGIAAQGEVLMQPIRELMKKECFAGSRSELPELLQASLGNTAGMIGAANLIK